MRSWSVLSKPLELPIPALAVIFVAWKILLLVVAASSPGPGYDTSTTLIQPYTKSAISSHPALLLLHISRKLTRWDAIYFSKISSRGYLFEQEWAFGWGFTRLVAFFAHRLKDLGFGDCESLESLVGIGLSHASHGLSVLVLYFLGRLIFTGSGGHTLSFIAACLHILSPAGLFLSAPYGESTFALLAFLGYFLFARSFFFTRESAVLQDVLIVASGIVLGFATTIRSNGLFNSILFLEEVVRIIISMRISLRLASIRRLVATGVGGICTAMGFLLPQYIAYQQYCNQNLVSDAQVQRVWCRRSLPSVYTFVQDHYWNVGFLKYWTVSNIPLFLLAFPMLVILFISSLWTLNMDAGDTTNGNMLWVNSRTHGEVSRIPVAKRLLRSLAIPQFMLAVLAVTNYHVQIITRVSSGYCIWYFWLSVRLIEATTSFSFGAKRRGSPERFMGSILLTTVVKYLVIYALIQGGLYSSFLPPA